MEHLAHSIGGHLQAHPQHVLDAFYDLLEAVWTQQVRGNVMCSRESGKVCVKTLEYAIDVDDVELECEVNNLKTRQIHVSIWIL